MQKTIQFGTDGWRAIIAEDFTVENVQRVAWATGQWLIKQPELAQRIVIGYDCRFGGPLFARRAAEVFSALGIRVDLSESFVTTPMVSLAVRQLRAGLGVVITASHNPPEYNGFKLKGAFGGPLLPEQVKEVEALIPEHVPDMAPQPGLISIADLETLYVSNVRQNFNLKAIGAKSPTLAYNPMFGAGQRVLPRLLPDVALFNARHNPLFEGIAPEPILRNLQDFVEWLRDNPEIQSALVTDGDADRIALFSSGGRFVDSHHIILLLIHYLAHYRGLKGRVVTAFSTTDRVKKICAHYGLPHTRVQIGFKYIAGYFLQEDVLLGGEESGGIAVKGHIPERDGIWMGLTLWEFMATTGKTLDELIGEVYAITGPFAYDRLDLRLDAAQKAVIMGHFSARPAYVLGRQVASWEDLDGLKCHFADGSWLMVRASGTEPVIRVYAESHTAEEVQKLLNDFRHTYQV
ncbi:MAG: phosphoglucomutase/phosphomannomutase family protein [Flavobacteriales bacterium]|nr:phosphoglucomutase/phosphomannomutase family protein [Flavobacteriales bacterium]MCX7650308.1 phosphoglucomutase/phosphomannomutase family protein [Flavobacteriales bacterium]MDW8432080.1 phosphoglucomutase/phosphomannomutase family protein [Flavobacteriales bacterium]